MEQILDAIIIQRPNWKYIRRYMAKNQRNNLSELKNYISGLDFGHTNKSDILLKARIV